jgi:hypothetical protein
MKRLQDIASRIAQRDRPAVWTTHRARSRRQRAQQPIDFFRLQPHIDLDRRAARDRRRHRPPQFVQRRFTQFALRNFQNLKEHTFDVRRADSRRRRFYSDRAIAKRLRLEPERVQFLGDARIFDLLRRAESNHQRHQQPLRFGMTLFARRQYLLEQNSLMRHMLIDDP